MPNPAVRQNFLASLEVLRRELGEAERLERDAEQYEQREERTEQSIAIKEISASMIARKSPLPFKVGSANDCDEKIHHLSPHHGLISMKDGCFIISSSGSLLCVPEGRSLDHSIEVPRKGVMICQNCTLYFIVGHETKAIMHLKRD